MIVDFDVKIMKFSNVLCMNNMKLRQSFVAVMASKRLENRGVMPRGYHCGIQILEKL